MSQMDPMQRMLLMILFGHWLDLAKRGKIEELIADMGKALATLEEDSDA